MPSLPESGPTRMSTPSCSTRRRASSTALSGVESEPPYTISIGCPAIVAPSTPSVGSPLVAAAVVVAAARCSCHGEDERQRDVQDPEPVLPAGSAVSHLCSFRDYRRDP